MIDQVKGSIRNATMDDITEVVYVHKICFPNSFSTQLGQKLLERYYEEYLKRVPELFFVHLNINNNIDGFCMGYYLDEKYPYTKKFLYRNLLRIGGRLIFLAVTGNQLLYRKIKKTIFKEQYEMVEPGYLEDRKRGEFGDLLSICVLPEQRGSGAARDLILEFNNYLSARGYKGCILSTNSDNIRGIKFYLKCGYKIYAKSENVVCFYQNIE